MQRTTVALEPAVLAALKRRAADQGRSVQELANELLRRGLEARPPRAGYRLELRGWEAELQPGVDLTDREKLFDLLAAVAGNLVHGAHIAALCLEHGVSELLTADADFSRFRELRTRNPFRG